MMNGRNCTIFSCLPQPPTRNPSRRFKALRREVEEFTDLVKILNAQVVEEAGSENVAQTTAKMHEAVERMAAEADKTS